MSRALVKVPLQHSSGEPERRPGNPQSERSAVGLEATCFPTADPRYRMDNGN